MAINQEEGGLRTKPVLSPQEQMEASSQLRQETAQKTWEPINIGNYAEASPLSQFQTQQSLISETGIAANLRQKKRELQLRKTEKGSGQLGLESSGLASTNIKNPKAQAEKWGGNTGTITSMMGSLRQRTHEAKEAQKGALGELGEQALNAAAMPISLATSELLQQSWLNLIDSWGATLIYINFHVFCRLVVGEKFFCKLGHEWLGGKSGGELGAAESGAAKAGGAKSSGMQSLFGWPQEGVGLLEVAALALLDLLVICLIFISLEPIVLLAYIAVEPLNAIWTSVIDFVTLVLSTIGLK